MARRRRLRNSSRDNYEFDLVADEEAEGLTRGGAAAGMRQKGKRRAGELYDAFAAGSDDEDFEDFDDEDGVDYQDKHVVGGDDDEDMEDGSPSDENAAKERLLEK
jgi:kexin